MAGRKKLELTALFGLVVQVIFLCTAFALYSASGSGAVYAEMWHLLPGILVWFVVLVHGRQRRLAAEEREEMDEHELDQLRASTSLRILQKYAVPAFSIILSLVMFGLGYYIFSGIRPWSAEPEVQNLAATGVGMVFISFLGFLTGKYAAGMAREQKYRLLRASAGYLLGNVVACLLVTVSLGALHFGVRWPEKIVTYLIPIGMALVSAEIIINLILDIYRPRVPGQEPRPPYDSRMLGLFAEPGGVVKTISDTLDYQFGFKVSETWFYQFMERAIVPLILVQLLILWLLTSIVVVDQYEVAFVERFGTPVVTKADAEEGLKATVYEPGYYLKAPWPIDMAYHVPAHNIHRLTVGRIEYETQQETDDPNQVVEQMSDPDVILWTERHIHPSKGYEPNILVPSSEDVYQEKAPAINLARVLGRVHYRVKLNSDGSVNPKAAYHYFYENQETESFVKDLAYSVLSRIGASQDFLSWVTMDREKRNKDFREKLQQAVEKHELGVEIVMAGVPVVHPPPQTAEAYEKVINAYQQKEATILDGRAEAISTKADGNVKSTELLQQAKSEGYSISTLAKADAERFLEQLKAYEKAPEVYRNRRYFTALEGVLSNHRLYVLPDSKQEVQVLNLQEKVSSDLLDFSMEEATQ